MKIITTGVYCFVSCQLWPKLAKYDGYSQIQQAGYELIQSWKPYIIGYNISGK